MRTFLVTLGVMFATQASAVDLVMIDTGTVAYHSGAIKMNATCIRKCWSFHGELMARALEEQLDTIAADPKKVAHLVWTTGEQIPPMLRYAAHLRPTAISMSLAGPVPIPVERAAVKYASDQGILVLAAAGNSGVKYSEYPAGYKGIDCLVSVSAKMNNIRAVWPLTGAKASVGEIYLEGRADDNGTSPSVQRAAAYALKYKESHPNATCHELKRYLLFRFGAAHYPLK